MYYVYVVTPTIKPFSKSMFWPENSFFKPRCIYFRVMLLF